MDMLISLYARKSEQCWDYAHTNNLLPTLLWTTTAVKMFIQQKKTNVPIAAVNQLLV